MAAGFTTIWVTEGLRTLAFLWQWPQSLQLSEWTEGLRIPAMLWQWPQGLQLSEWTEMAAGFTTI